ncbi:MAG: DUF4124 domain-containing protein [Gammaproteobacteria bacterium]|nr:DUF4124 domain-containing protein [Gammaproteobacteria bacterium]
MKLLAIIIVALFVVITNTMAYAQIYQWVDSKGKVTYSDKPQSDKPASINSTTKQPASKDTSYQQQLQKQQRLLDSYSQRRAENKRRLTEQNRKQQQQQDKLDKRCAKYKRYLDTGGGVYKTDANGERVFVKESELTSYRAQKQAEYDRYCQ